MRRASRSCASNPSARPNRTSDTTSCRPSIQAGFNRARIPRNRRPNRRRSSGTRAATRPRTSTQWSSRHENASRRVCPGPCLASGHPGQGRSRAKNEISAVLARRLIERPPLADLLGVTGRRWLADAGDPAADDAPGRQPHLRRDVHRRDRPRRPVHDQPQAGRVSRAGSGGPPVRWGAGAVGADLPARLGLARCALVEAAWSVVKQPGPLPAFYERVRARRGHGKAIVATARRLAILFWCMLRRGEDYAHRRPALTKKKLRELELTAGAKRRTKAAAGIWSNQPRDPRRRARAHAAGRGVLPADGHRPAGRTNGESRRERDTGARKD